MKKKQIKTIKDFEQFLDNLPLEENVVVYIDDKEEEETEEYRFRAIKFDNDYMILHDDINGNIGVISDYMGIVRREDYISSLWNDFTSNGKTVFIEEKETKSLN